MPEPQRAIDRPTALTLGTAGHIDHGKTTLIGALTATNTDRLEEERRRGISIELGFAELTLPDGRSLGVVDVPGHQRLVRAMVAGATGIDLFLLVIAADDGVMPQTREHWTALRALGIGAGVIAINKCDVAEAELVAVARAEAEQLAPGIPVVEVSARTGHGVDRLLGVLQHLAAGTADEKATRVSRSPSALALHLDRAFSLRGIGTVVTGTLRSGSIEQGRRVRILPSRRVARVRSIEVHGQAVSAAGPGRRVALNLSGVDREQVARGDVVAALDTDLVGSFRLDVALDDEAAKVAGGERFQVHHGTRQSAARAVPLASGRVAQLRLESALIAMPGDRLVIRRIAPPDTIGGATVIDQRPSRHGAHTNAARALEAALAGEPEEILLGVVEALSHEVADDPGAWRMTPVLGFAHDRFSADRWRTAIDALCEQNRIVRRGQALLPPQQSPMDAPAAEHELDPLALALLALIDSDGLRPRSSAQLAGELDVGRAEVERRVALLVAAGKLSALPGGVVYPVARLQGITDLVTELARARGSISLAELRDALAISRRYSQAMLEWLDSSGVTVRHGDRHVLRRPLERGGGPEVG